MNIEQWEDKIIDFLEGDNNEAARQEIIQAAVNDQEINSLWESYQSMYATMDTIAPAEICAESKIQFDTFIQKEIDKQNNAAPSGSKIVSMSKWKSIMAIAAVSVGVLFMWNHNRHDQEMSAHLATVSNQLEAIMESNSSTEKIKAIRVSYDSQTNTADEKTKQLLVSVLKNDPSSNVRLAAVEALSKYTNDDLIREALIKSLMHEEDGFVKLALIKSLSQQFNNNVADTFEEIVNDKTNEKFIRDEIEKELFRHNRIES